MALDTYKKKRNFNKTPEPKDKKEKITRGNLRFSFQRHQASRLHYDLRLEMDGVLKSWAIPKGPSLNPKDKRLAMMTEDHPYDYIDFEGVIPAGNYGAGIVDVFDEGTYSAPGIKDRKKSEKELLEGLKDGNLKFELKGKKIKGVFALVKMQDDKDNAWLLIKKEDKYAVDGPFNSEDLIGDLTSIKKGLKKEDVTKKTKPTKSKKTSEETKTPEIPTQPMPHDVKPMLAKIGKGPFDDKDWIFEMKYDGYRAIAEVDKGKVELYSRNQLTFNRKFAKIAERLSALPHQAVLDGEIVVHDKDGKPKFQLLQNYQKTGKGDIYYYVFDLLYLNGYELSDLTLLDRKKLLKQIIKELGDPIILYSDHIKEEGKAFFEEVKTQQLEGIIAKKSDSLYRKGQRSSDWLKIKTSARQEAVIAGFTEPRGSRKLFGALVLGVYEKGELQYIGHTGGGFNSKSLKMMMEKLEPLIRKTSPFKKKVKTNMPVTWVKPVLVCEVSFGEWTAEGNMRHPIFEGLREDKPAKEVVREQPTNAQPDEKSPQTEKKKGKSSPNKKTSSKPKSPISNKDKERQLELNGQKIHLTSLDKLYWPDEGYTKGDLIQYYLQVSDYILPYLKGRPQNMLRHPNGIKDKGFFHKDVSELNLDWQETVEIYSESNDKELRYLVCNDQATLTYMNQLGCIEINPWNSRIESLANPDYIVIDLDPGDNTFDEIIETALVVKKVLDRAKAEAYIKTSGSRGMHIYVPMGARYEYEDAKDFALLIAQLAHEQLPKLTSLKRSPKERKKQIYLDYLQNRKGQTLAAAYSVRPKPDATVSTPLKWEEVKPGLYPSKFTIKTICKRLEKEGDLFKGVLGKGIDMKKCLKNLGG